MYLCWNCLLAIFPGQQKVLYIHLCLHYIFRNIEKINGNLCSLPYIKIIKLARHIKQFRKSKMQSCLKSKGRWVSVAPFAAPGVFVVCFHLLSALVVLQFTSWLISHWRKFNPVRVTVTTLTVKAYRTHCSSLLNRIFFLPARTCPIILEHNIISRNM